MNKPLRKYLNYRLIFLFSAFLLCVVFAVVVNGIYEIDIVYTHLFYIPILLTGIWYPRYAVFLAAALGLIHIACDYATGETFTIGSLLRAIMFMVVAYLTSYLALRLDRLHNSLRESEEKHRLLIENSHDIIYTMTVDGVFTFVSPAWTALLGHPVNQVAGQPFQQFVHPDDLAGCMAWQQKVIETGQRQEGVEYRVRNIDGFWRWHYSNAVPLKDETGKVVGFEGSAIDITERKQAAAEKAELESQNRQLQKAESLGRMAGAIAHHFNNQLGVVIGNLELAMMELSQGASPHAKITAAMKASNRAAEMSGLMLTYLGQSFDKREPLDLSDACRRSLPMLQAVMPGDVVLESDLPSPGPAISANANYIQQILTNLITNAWEAVAEGRGAIHLTVKTATTADIPKAHRFPIDWQPQDNAYACLEVTDAGGGIADKDIEKIFDPFFSSKFTGRGLGLAVVLGIVRVHSGVVTVESEPDRGSAFRVYFPMFAEEVDKAAQALERRRSQGAAGRRRDDGA